MTISTPAGVDLRVETDAVNADMRALCFAFTACSNNGGSLFSTYPAPKTGNDVMKLLQHIE
jgi:hypothetical protein